MAQGERFTAYLSRAEREGLRQMAQRNHTSENYLLRIAWRRFVQLPVPTDGYFQMLTSDELANLETEIRT